MANGPVSIKQAADSILRSQREPVRMENNVVGLAVLDRRVRDNPSRDEPATSELTFEDFWKEYPRRVGKPIARAKFAAITNGGLETRTLDKDSGTYITIKLQATAAELVEGAKRYYSRSRKKGGYGFVDDGRYLLHPATWLNQGRWEDD